MMAIGAAMAKRKSVSSAAKELAAESLQRELTVGDVAERSGVAVSAVHFYESKGLIQSWRNAGNQRRYHREVLRRIAIIKVGQRLGIPLAEIQHVFKALPASRAPTAGDWQKLSAKWRADLDDRIARLQKMREQMSSCIGCGCLSLKDCPLRNPWDELAERGPGPQLLEPDGKQ